MSDPAAEIMAHESERGVKEAAWRTAWPRILIVGLLLLAAGVLARLAGAYIPIVVSWVDSLGFWGPLAFVLLYVAATVFVVPGVVLTLAGGAIFGLVRGTIYVFVAATLGACAAFLVGRYGARGWVERQLQRSPRFAAVDRAVAANGLRITFLLRLSPIFPFSLLNYALGLTQVAFRDYLIACAGMLPATVLYVYYGQVVGDLAVLAGGASADRDAKYWAVTGLGLAATVAVTTVVTRIARRALAEVDELESS